MLVVYLGALAFLLRRGLLAPRRSHVGDRQRVRSGRTSDALGRSGLPNDHPPHGRHRGGRHGRRTSSLAFPLAYYAARVVTPRFRNALLIAVVLPLWANYLVRVFAWRLILTPNGFLNWLAERTGIGSLQIGNSNWAVWLSFTYLWLPFMVLPIYAALERVPESFLEASGDLGREGMDHVPRASCSRWSCPGIVAGSIFSFSLTLGDYIAPEPRRRTRSSSATSSSTTSALPNNLRSAAAFAMVPVVDHGRLPAAGEAARAPSRRCRRAVESRGGARRDPGRAPGCALAFLYIPLRDRRALRVQRQRRADVADRGLHDEVVRHRLAQRRRARSAGELAWRSRSIATVLALILGSRRPSRCTGSGSSGATPSRSLLVLPIALPGIVTAIALNSAIDTFGHPVRPAHDLHRPRDVLHRRRLQQRARAAAPDADLAGRGLDGPRRRRVADVPLRDVPRDPHGAHRRRRCWRSRCRSTRSS